MAGMKGGAFLLCHSGLLKGEEGGAEDGILGEGWCMVILFASWLVGGNICEGCGMF